MKTINGDLLTFALSGRFDIIVHGCNCFNTMGGGIAYQIAKVFPEACEVDLKTVRGDRSKLGTFTVAKHDNFYIVNAYTQFDCSSNKVNADYSAIRSCFKKIKERFTGLRIGYPMIGAGLAGGDWNIISKIIDEKLVNEDHTLVIWEKS